MKNLKDLAQGIVLIGTLSAVFYGSHAFQTDEFAKKQLSFEGRRVSIDEIHGLKDIYSKVFFAGVGTAIAGGGLLYYVKRKEKFYEE